jgi:hypothetical protein
LALVVLVVIVVIVILAVTLSGNKQPSSSTSTTLTSSSESSTTTTQVTGSGEITTSPTSAASGATTYTADLGGGNEIPALTTAASGTLTLTVSADGTSVAYALQLSSIISPTVARLHEGKAGATGATIFTIWGGPTKSGLYTGTVAKGSFKAANLGGPLKGKKISDLVTLIKAESVYVNVGTQSHPQGEIRGQVQ